MTNTLRRCIFRPYRKGMGPSFELHMWDTGRMDSRGQTYIGYILHGRACKGAPAVELFKGEDFTGSPLHADDSDKTVAGLMGFLTLRPGDTDREHFATYTALQLDYCKNHAESLSCEVTNRFGEF